MKRAMEMIERNQRMLQGPPNREEWMRRRREQERRDAQAQEMVEQAKAAMAEGDYETAMRIARKLKGVVTAPSRPPKSQRPRCDATTRKGERCKALAVWLPNEWAPRNGKCRVHGGLSTGPKTPEGKAAIAESNRRRAKALRDPECDLDGSQ